MLHFRNFRPSYLILVLAAVLALTAQAGVVEYSDRTAWLAATSNVAKIDFMELYRPNEVGLVTLPPAFSANTTPTAVTVNFSNSANTSTGTGTFWVHPWNYNGNTMRGPDSFATLGTYPANKIFIGLPSGIKAFAMYVFTGSQGDGMNGGNVTVEFLGNSYTRWNGNQPDTQFRGYVSTEEIGVITLTPDSTSHVIGLQRLELDLPPAFTAALLYNPLKAVKSGSTIPIKLQLLSGGRNVSAPSLVVHAVTLLKIDTTASTQVLDDAGNANPDFDFRYDPTLGGAPGGYIFNLKTTGLTTGTYHLKFTVNGMGDYTANFDVK